MLLRRHRSARTASKTPGNIKVGVSFAYLYSSSTSRCTSANERLSQAHPPDFKVCVRKVLKRKAKRAGVSGTYTLAEQLRTTLYTRAHHHRHLYNHDPHDSALRRRISRTYCRFCRPTEGTNHDFAEAADAASNMLGATTSRLSRSTSVFDNTRPLT